MATKTCPTQTRALAIVKAAATGVSSAELGRLVGITPKSASGMLCRMARLGLVASVRARQHSVWCTPSRYPALRAAIQPKPRVVKKTSHRPRPAKPEPAQAVAPEERDDPLLFKKPRIVPAAIAPRIETRGVPSVFHLGYAA